MTRSLLRAVPPLGGAATDVLIENDRFAAFGSTVGAVDDVIDGAGFLMLPGPIESHEHIDKTLWGEPWRSNSAGPTLTDLIENERRVLRTVTTPTASRAKALVRHYVARGTTRLRTHVDVNPETGLGSVQALLGLRERLRDLVDIELVAFPQRGMLITPGTADLMDAAIGVGIETIGGIDPAGIGRDPIRHLETIFTIAERRGCAVDIHLHDGGELGAWQIERIVDFVAATGLQGRTMISHAYCLGELPPARQEALGRRLAEQRVALMTTGAVRQRAAAGAAAARWASPCAWATTASAMPGRRSATATCWNAPCCSPTASTGPRTPSSPRCSPASRPPRPARWWPRPAASSRARGRWLADRLHRVDLTKLNNLTKLIIFRFRSAAHA